MKINEYNIFNQTFSEIDLEKKKIINTINAHAFVTSKKDYEFFKALKNSDIILPDGIGIVMAYRILYGLKIKKKAGIDFHNYILTKLNEKKGKVFYMGSTNETLLLIRDKLKKDFPDIKSEFFSPPFKPKLNKKDNEIIINKINQFNPNVLFIGMTAPKQEKWLFENKDQIHFDIASCVGAAFDFYSGKIKRAPKWMIISGFEWLHRSLQSWRLFKRNISNFIFIKDIILEYFTKKN